MLRPACRPPAAGRAGCLALGLIPAGAAARARVHSLTEQGVPQTGLTKASECAADYPSSCLTPQDLTNAYLPGEQPEAPAGSPQTIALIDAYNDLNAEADLRVYATEFALPACTSADGCFQKVGASGGETSSSLPFPKTKSELELFAAGTARQRAEAEEAEGWALETATDIEVAHAVCHNCHILLVEADGPEYPELETAENTAAKLGATEISNSWGGPEDGNDAQAFNHPGIAITAAAGDDGYLNWKQYATRGEEGSPYFDGADYPASSPHVISVGGTELKLGAGGAWQSESVWSTEGAGGSGCSASLAAPSWQLDVKDWAQVGCGQERANADISADADPTTGVNIYDSTTYPYEEEGQKLTTVLHWVPIGGTSVASPIIASMFALAGGAHEVAYPAQTLYSHLGSSLLHDVTSGGNGECGGSYVSCSGSLSSPLDCGAGALICNATGGYDGPSGVGTPNGVGAFKPSGTPAKIPEEGGPSSSPPGEPSKSKEEQPPGSGSPGPAGSGGQTSGSSSSSSTVGETAVEPNGSSTGAGTTDSALETPRITALALTVHARAALRHDRLARSSLAFSCVLSRGAAVEVTLAVQIRSSVGTHWHTLEDSFAFDATRGLNRRRLHGSAALAPGLYRLTLTPAGGAARSLTIRVP